MNNLLESSSGQSALKVIQVFIPDSKFVLNDLVLRLAVACSLDFGVLVVLGRTMAMVPSLNHYWADELSVTSYNELNTLHMNTEKYWCVGMSVSHFRNGFAGSRSGIGA